MENDDETRSDGYNNVGGGLRTGDLDAHGLSAHGHLMIYPALPPAWATNGADKATLARRYERRIRQLGAHYGARVPQWDVVNETVDRSCRPGGPFHDKVCWGRPQLLVPEDYTFRGFRGRYRLSWTGEDGKTASTFVTLE